MCFLIHDITLIKEKCINRAYVRKSVIKSEFVLKEVINTLII